MAQVNTAVKTQLFYAKVQVYFDIKTLLFQLFFSVLRVEVETYFYSYSIINNCNSLHVRTLKNSKDILVSTSLCNNMMPLLLKVEFKQK